MSASTIKFGGFFVFIGLTIAVFSIKSYLTNSALASEGVEGVAEVVRIYTSGSSESPSYLTRIELPNPEKTRTNLRMTRETKNKYKVGEKLQVVYIPEDPMKVKVGSLDSVSGGGGSSLLGFLFGLALACGGFLWIAKNGFRDS